MKNLKSFLLLPLLLLITNCLPTKLTNDYGKLSNEEKQLIQPLTSFESTQPKKVYKINATQLREELRKNEKSIVYLFTNGCSSKLCKPMSFYENYAKENNYKLYLVMTGYGHLNKTLVQNFNSPLFSIDDEYYKTRYNFKYVKRFENELQGKPINTKQREYKGSIYIFKKDQLLEIKRDL